MPHIRTVKLAPYRKGTGPTFTLAMHDTGRYDRRGQTLISYTFWQHDPGVKTLLFSGLDFAGSPLHADDSDTTVAALLGFLTLRPGDTDPEYFAEYTDVQRAFCEQHAEALACEAMSRFGGE